MLTQFGSPWFSINGFIISSLRYFDWTSLMMHFSACCFWLISSIWTFLLAKLIVIFLLSPVSMVCFLWWLTFHHSINAIARFNFNQQEYLFSKLDTRSSFIRTELTFICFFHSRLDVPSWFSSSAEDLFQTDCAFHKNAGPWNYQGMLEEFSNVILLEASLPGLSSDGM